MTNAKTDATLTPHEAYQRLFEYYGMTNMDSSDRYIYDLPIQILSLRRTFITYAPDTGDSEGVGITGFEMSGKVFPDWDDSELFLCEGETSNALISVNDFQGVSPFSNDSLGVFSLPSYANNEFFLHFNLRLPQGAYVNLCQLMSHASFSALNYQQSRQHIGLTMLVTLRERPNPFVGFVCSDITHCSFRTTQLYDK